MINELGEGELAVPGQPIFPYFGPGYRRVLSTASRGMAKSH